MTPQQLKYRAHLEVCKAIAAGRLEQQPCESCGALPERVNGRNVIEGHHHKGYDEEHWLDVQWLCRACHRACHRRCHRLHGASNRILCKLAKLGRCRAFSVVDGDKLPRGTVYHTLTTMVGDGLVEKSWTRGSVVPVPMYEISPKGRDHLLSIDRPGSLEEQLNEWSARQDLAMDKRSAAEAEIDRCSSEIIRIGLEKEGRDVESG